MVFVVFIFVEFFYFMYMFCVIMILIIIFVVILNQSIFNVNVFLNIEYNKFGMKFYISKMIKDILGMVFKIGMDYKLNVMKGNIVV